jgi:hypothetical protein
MGITLAIVFASTDKAWLPSNYPGYVGKAESGRLEVSKYFIFNMIEDFLGPPCGDE